MKLFTIIVLLTTVSGAQSQNSMENPNQNTMNLSDSHSDFVCLLSNAEFAQRRNDMLKGIFAHVAEIVEVSDGYVFHFQDDELFLPNLFNYILAEKKCCPFFQQEVIIKPHNEGVSWKISGKEGVKEVIKMLLEEPG